MSTWPILTTGLVEFNFDTLFFFFFNVRLPRLIDHEFCAQPCLIEIFHCVLINAWLNVKTFRTLQYYLDSLFILNCNCPIVINIRSLRTPREQDGQENCLQLHGIGLSGKVKQIKHMVSLLPFANS